MEFIVPSRGGGGESYNFEGLSGIHLFRVCGTDRVVAPPRDDALAGGTLVDDVSAWVAIL